MTIQDLIDVLDEFRNQYDTSTDPYVQKLCVFITNTINGLNSYIVFFKNSKSAIQSNQQQLEQSMVTIDQLITDDGSDDGGTTDPSIDDLIGG